MSFNVISKKMVDRVNKVELLSSLRSTLEKNTDAIDNVSMWVNSCEDRLNYNENDIEAKEALETLKYIDFSLRYLDKMYMKCFKDNGGKV